MFKGYWRFIPLKEKNRRHETEHSSPARAKVQNCGAILPISIRIHGMVLNKHFGGKKSVLFSDVPDFSKGITVVGIFLGFSSFSFC
jgi:hypothetical protein